MPNLMYSVHISSVTFHSLPPNSPSPIDAGPVALAQYTKLAPAACANCAPLGCCTASDTDRFGGIDTSISRWSRLIDPACTHLMRLRRLAQLCPAPAPNVATKHRATVFRHPNQVILAASNRVDATLVCFHPHNLSPQPAA